jgi:TonB family protein
VQAAKPEAKAAPAAPPPKPPVETDSEGEPMPAEPPQPAQARAEPPKEPAKEAEKPAEAPPPEPPPAKALTFDLEGTDSDTDAMVVQGRILPASPDDRFRNRLPSYPDDAVRRREHGDVILVIHVSPAGVASGVDVVQSSGSASLDRAAVTAVMRWRFHPAMKDGQQIPFDMPFRFDFEPY